MSPDGRYCTSKIHNSLASRFGICSRPNLNTKNFNPGPGNYKLPSEFGHYVDKKAITQTKEDKENINS